MKRFENMPKPIRVCLTKTSPLCVQRQSWTSKRGDKGQADLGRALINAHTGRSVFGSKAVVQQTSLECGLLTHSRPKCGVEMTEIPLTAPHRKPPRGNRAGIFARGQFGAIILWLFGGPRHSYRGSLQPRCGRHEPGERPATSASAVRSPSM
jgi:hypothetical protein